MKKISKELANLYRNDSGIYVFRKVIPIKLRELAGKSEFKISLKTSEISEAVANYEVAKRTTDGMLADLKRGKPLKEAITFDTAAGIAKAQGRALKPLENLLANESELLAAFSEWSRLPNKTPQNFKSYFNADRGDIKISELVEAFQRNAADELASLNEKDLRKKLAPHHLACKELISHLGYDKEVRNISLDDALSFEGYLRGRIAAKDLKPNSANKRFFSLRVLIKSYHRSIGVRTKHIDTPFDEMKFAEHVISRNPFSIAFIKKNWLQVGVFDGLNVEARCILFAMLDTGCGFKELCGLDPKTDIQLNSPFPHIIIKVSEERSLKTGYRTRKIPLVGYALKAFKECPSGFPRYRGQSGYENASATINKFLKKNGLNEMGACTAIGLRHLFKDRLREHAVQEELQDRLMGHKTHGMGPNYGNGFTMKHFYGAMKKIEGDFTQFDILD
ncbi:DUF6538 domain-containing protein [Agrobacterium larrymoorei]|uniref:DUF6538 domain-containing protein n=1 Tax=Agrobacterium larrymoorei TaxID=160699 RepID=A0AAF0H8R5_9HYPH|nr:DUF6538 domain-containing protein [Agrobacterium larrymoorei]WHA41926.1 hypothetical protein CFBP5477_004660 [Agrobacterium larrymoorei]